MSAEKSTVLLHWKRVEMLPKVKAWCQFSKVKASAWCVWHLQKYPVLKGFKIHMWFTA